MVQHENIRCLTDNQPLNNVFFFTVTVPAHILEKFFQTALHKQQITNDFNGFKKGTAPISYVQEHFKNPIITHLKDLGLKFFALKAVMQHIHNQKIVLVGAPELKNISIDNHGNALYTFQGYTPKELYMQSWKYLPFKPTPRKKYRDIDKQVTLFMQEEEALTKNYNPNHGVQINDWVFFKTSIVNHLGKPILEEHAATTWLRIGDEEPDLDFQQIFLKKKIGDRIISENQSLQTYFCENSYTHNNIFMVEIIDIVPSNSFSFDLFKNYFKIKSHKDLTTKFTEVFSFSNDISQRRSIAHEALGIIIKKNQIILPDQAVHQHKREIINDLQFKPDFMVYKMNPQFDTHITNLAQRNLMDSVVTEFIGYQDNITATHNDIKAALQCSQRPRLKDFLYFPLLKSQIEGQEFPIDHESVYHFCLKEKILNHIIYHLTKK